MPGRRQRPRIDAPVQRFAGRGGAALHLVQREDAVAQPRQRLHHVEGGRGQRRADIAAALPDGGVAARMLQVHRDEAGLGQRPAEIA